MRPIDIEAEVCADCVCRDKCDRQAYCWAKEMKTVDAVPVVRCKDCFYHDYAKANEKGFLICPASGMEITDYDYCSYGERKEGAG